MTSVEWNDEKIYLLKLTEYGLRILELERRAPANQEGNKYDHFRIGVVKNISQFHVTAGDLVHEKYGKITKDYVLLNPPIGKGNRTNPC
jgi:hypothetical protein